MKAETLAEFKRLWKEAEAVALSHDEFLELIYRAAVELAAQEKH
jgi:hypothetical protein